MTVTGPLICVGKIFRDKFNDNSKPQNKTRITVYMVIHDHATICFCDADYRASFGVHRAMV